MTGSGVLAMSTKDRQRLRELLRKLPGAMDLEELDGFLAAVVCSPRFVPMSEHLPPIWRGQSLEDELFADPADTNAFYRLSTLCWSDLLGRIVSHQPFQPLLLEDEGDPAPGKLWARGFIDGMNLSPSDWEGAINDKEVGSTFTALAALAFEGDPALPPAVQSVEPDIRDRLLAVVAELVPLIYEYFTPQRDRAAAAFGGGADAHDLSWSDRWPGRGYGPAPYRREAPKVGRNEPCPCGSGKKYKRCCGAGG